MVFSFVIVKPVKFHWYLVVALAVSIASELLPNMLIGTVPLVLLTKFNEITSRMIKIKEYQRIEKETKVFHEEKIQELKTTLNKAKNAKKIDYNDGGNFDDDFLLKALE
jgi:hypothetical protein